MTDTRVHLIRATALLREGHQDLKKLFSKCAVLDPEQLTEKFGIFQKIRKELKIHLEVEEQVFYPAVAASENADSAELVRKATEEHRIIRLLIEELAATNPGVPVFDSSMKALEERLLRHAGEEQNEIFVSRRASAPLACLKPS